MRDLFERLDPAARLLTVVGAAVIVVSTPRAVLSPFPAYFALCLLLILTGRASARHLFFRTLAVSPFLLLAAGLLAFEAGSLPAAASVAAKGYAAALLLAFLTGTTPLGELLAALRRLRSPASLNLILGMMHRYTDLLSEEYARLERARNSRTVRPLGKERFRVYGRQLGALLLRSWDRAERVHAAMLARGFTGEWPEPERRPAGVRDAAFPGLTCALFLAARLWL